jgi:hypothetical protein
MKTILKRIWAGVPDKSPSIWSAVAMAMVGLTCWAGYRSAKSLRRDIKYLGWQVSAMQIRIEAHEHAALKGVSSEPCASGDTTEQLATNKGSVAVWLESQVIAVYTNGIYRLVGLRLVEEGE